MDSARTITPTRSETAVDTPTTRRRRIARSTTG
ncbi:hypothetical protein M768_17105 [Cellulosimicrobium cellulans F16]|uniref:Uncharacterized protein n=1 Tax=Cellulosimicrobium cellulans F16 TaxID=1350482 RepID=A0A0M0F3M5_CELCE|nr:hypothetical protein M768_17105 [Cellulosimicrobium cellulans F16]